MAKLNATVNVLNLEEVKQMLRERDGKIEQLEKEIKGLKADKETLANSLSIESNRTNELNKENEHLKKAVQWWIDEEEKLENGIRVFVNKHFTGGSKANRDDYGQMVSTSDIYELRELLIKGEEN